jgi:hypothetical protein
MWLILIAAMLVLLGIGMVFVVTHAIAALHTVSDVGAGVSKRLSMMSGAQEDARDEGNPPIFTVPLCEAADRYTDARTQVELRKRHRVDRHTRTWAQWKNFNV